MATEEELDSQLLDLMVSEFREMPGLALTLPQACRLFGCDAATGQRLAEALVRRGVVRWSKDHRLRRVGGEA